MRTQMSMCEHLCGGAESRREALGAQALGDAEHFFTLVQIVISDSQMKKLEAQ